VLLTISGPIGFGVARGLKQSVAQLDSTKTLLIDFTDARLVGITSTIAIEDIILDCKNKGQQIFLSSICPRVNKDLTKIKLLQKIKPAHVFKTRLAALKYMTTIQG